MKNLATATAVILAGISLQAFAVGPKEEKTTSGIVITTLKDGAGANPKSSDTGRSITAACLRTARNLIVPMAVGNRLHFH